MRLRSRKADDARKTPAWIVSFSDMVTLLLAFFIMLQAFASKRDRELLGLGREGFRRAISGLGIPDLLFGQRDAPRLGYFTRRYPTDEDPENIENLRVIDDQDDRIRQVFEDLRRLRDVKTSDHEGSPARLLNTPIVFAASEAALTPPARTFLREFAVQLRERPGGKPPHVVVLGLAPDAEAPEAQWALSVRRAAAVEAFLREHLPRELRDSGARIEAWGTGPGEESLRRSAAAGPGATFIVLALMDGGAEE